MGETPRKGAAGEDAAAGAGEAAKEERKRARTKAEEEAPLPPPLGEEEAEDAEEKDPKFWERRFGRRLEGLVPDVVKRTLVGTMGSLFLSEDGLRQSLADLRLPKEVVSFIIQHADNTKREFMRIVAKELRDFLASTNFYDEVRKILTGLAFEIKTEVRLVPNDSFVKPEVKNSVRVKKKEKTPPEAADAGTDEESEADKGPTPPRP